MISHIKNALQEGAEALAALQKNEETLKAVSQAALTIISTFKNQGRVFSCGNGGSMCDAMHFAEELSGRFRKSRAPLAATAISDPAHMTCVGNDFGFDSIFSRFVESHARQGDTLLAISTSGKSPNILNAARVAKKAGVHVIALTGKGNSPLSELADAEICTPGGSFSDRIQELHIKIIHILIEMVERDLFPENYR